MESEAEDRTENWTKRITVRDRDNKITRQIDYVPGDWKSWREYHGFLFKEGLRILRTQRGWIAFADVVLRCTGVLTVLVALATFAGASVSLAASVCGVPMTITQGVILSVVGVVSWCLPLWGLRKLLGSSA